MTSHTDVLAIFSTATELCPTHENTIQFAPTDCFL